MVVCCQQQVVLGYLILLFLCLKIEFLWDIMLCLGWVVPEILRECVALIIKGEGVPDYVPWTPHPLTQYCIPKDSVQNLCCENCRAHICCYCAVWISYLFIYVFIFWVVRKLNFVLFNTTVVAVYDIWLFFYWFFLHHDNCGCKCGKQHP